MPTHSPAAGSARATGALVLMVAALICGGLVTCFDRSTVEVVAWSDRFEDDRQDLERELVDLLQADLMEHLPEDGPWRRELEVDVGQLERVCAEHWSALIRPGDGSATYSVVADSFVEPIDEDPGRFVEASPRIRVIDLSITLPVAEATSEDIRVEIRAAGARLDDVAIGMLRRYFEARGLEVQLASKQVGH